jgi:DNA-binding transcriptional regulator YiaG
MAIVRRTRSDIDLAKVDWAALEAVTDAEIKAQIAQDKDTAPVFTARELARAQRVTPAPSAREVKAIRRRLGLSQAQFAGPSAASGPGPGAVAHHRF